MVAVGLPSLHRVVQVGGEAIGRSDLHRAVPRVVQVLAPDLHRGGARGVEAQSNGVGSLGGSGKAERESRNGANFSRWDAVIGNRCGVILAGAGGVFAETAGREDVPDDAMMGRTVQGAVRGEEPVESVDHRWCAHHLGEALHHDSVKLIQPVHRVQRPHRLAQIPQGPAPDHAIGVLLAPGGMDSA